jgi:hypothetical protein
MEVLAPTSISPPAEAYPNTPARKPPSLLDRRPSAQKLLSQHHEPNTTSPMISTSFSSHSLPSSELSMLTDYPLVVGSSVRPLRTPTTLLPFVPLTPIMASPRMTPDLGTTSGSFSAVGIGGGASAGSSRVNGMRSGTSFSQSEGDYLTRGQPAGSSVVPAESLPAPLWTSTPPTPPNKDELVLSASQACSGVRVSDIPGSSKLGTSRPGRSRPTSIAIFSEYHQSGFPSMNMYDAAAASSRHPSFVSRSVSPPRAPVIIPRCSSHDDIYAKSGVKRRRTLPKHADTASPSSQPFLSAEGRHSRKRSIASGPDDSPEGDGVLLPSLSRSSRTLVRHLQSNETLTREGSTSSRTRKMFMLGDDASDNEAEGSANSSNKEQTPSEEAQNPIEQETFSKSSSAGLTRYHAFLELLTTEVGYLMDLRALVSVCGFT